MLLRRLFVLLHPDVEERDADGRTGGDDARLNHRGVDVTGIQFLELADRIANRTVQVPTVRRDSDDLALRRLIGQRGWRRHVLDEVGRERPDFNLLRPRRRVYRDRLRLFGDMEPGV